MSTKTLVTLVTSAVMLIVLLATAGSLVENVDADHYMVIQDPIDGELNFYTEPGWKPQVFGKVTKYPIRNHYEFEQSIRFNDAGKATLQGSIQWEMPNDNENFRNLHRKYGSKDAIEKQLVAKTVTKSVYMTGPLMSSRESYAEKRPDILRFVEDQIENGVYKTKQRTVKTLDPLTEQEKSITLTEIVHDESGLPLRQERSSLSEFGVRTFNFAIESMPYEERVTTQIQKQQELNMAVQTAIAEAKKAEQEKLTVEQQGKANVMKAQYEKEVEKTRAVVEAEQRLEVAKLDKKAAEQEKQRQILLGQGEAERKKLVMMADGALRQKLDALIEINKNYATAISQHKGPWVPSVIMGGNGKGSGSGSNAQHQAAFDLVTLLTAKTAKELATDLQVKAK